VAKATTGSEKSGEGNDEGKLPGSIAQPAVGRPLYASFNGDRWYLVRDSLGVAVLHVPNKSAGGQVDRMGVAEFFAAGAGPEQQELIRLIGTLIEG
jgi:hypothetical protein